MKKLLLLGISALVFAGCSNSFDLGDTPAPQADTTVKDYEAAFVSTFGTPAANQTWGFGTSSSQTRSRRAMNIGDDVYDSFTLPTSEELAAAYPSSIPADAEEVSDLATMDKYKTSDYNNGDLWWIYSKNGGGHNYKITKTGYATIGGGWKNEADQIFNVYVDVEGDVTIYRSGTEYMNLYILRGNVTIDYNWGECGGLVSVASGATVKDMRQHLAHNGGIKLFNRGTFNTNADYMIGNNAYVYNEATMTIGNGNNALSYNAGSGNAPCFYNVGDATVLRASSFTLNSNGGFISDGTVAISGETKVTQEGIIWVNNGHYTTGSLVFSAKNATFYNYCQLIVNTNTLFTDGEFNLMTNSYMQTQHGLMNNFIVNMYNNSGVNITDGIMTGRQGDGTYQGFRAVDDNAKVWVRIGGTSYIPVQQDGALRVQGANMTFGYDTMKFFEYTNGINLYSTWNTGNYWGETNQAALDAKQDPRIEWNKNNVTKIYTGSDFSQVTATIVDGQCAATWTPNDGTDPGTGGDDGDDDGDDDVVVPTLPSLHVMAEDLSASDASDFDFNDCVFDVYYVDANTVKIKVLAAGGTLPLRLCENDAWELHNLFDVDTQCMVNTGNKYHQPVAPYSQVDGKAAVELTLTGKTWSNDQNTFAGQVRDQIKMEVYKDGAWHELQAEQGKAAGKIATPVNIYMKDSGWFDNEYRWPYEKQYIGNSFNEYVANPSKVWYNTK